MARSFLQVAASEEVASPLRVVQIEGLVFCSHIWLPLFSFFFSSVFCFLSRFWVFLLAVTVIV
uniref:Uncharacterized protein n=1 Tax=Nelumbo nucifera TaxID=4432 RepID=A0A822ZGK1_NELNU|nr:TPA_asm: hypothetical protein HUJ06_002237 [Nelumbo nucifera]